MIIFKRITCPKQEIKPGCMQMTQVTHIRVKANRKQTGVKVYSKKERKLNEIKPELNKDNRSWT